MSGLSRSASVFPMAWFALVTAMSNPSPAQPELLPSRAGKWSRVDSVEVYVGRDLYLLIDGGADLYFEYGFVQVLSSEYSHINGEKAAIELYEMESASAAYGLFSSCTAGTGTRVPAGQEAVLGDGYCIVWTGAYVLMLTSASGASASGQYLTELASGLAAGIVPAGLPPDLCVLLRKSGLEPGAMVFVRGKLALEHHLPEAWADPLPPAEGVLGRSGTVRFLVLEYQDTSKSHQHLQDALAAWDKRHLSFREDPRGTWILTQAEEGHVLLKQYGRHILAVTGPIEPARTMVARLERILEDR